MLVILVETLCGDLMGSFFFAGGRIWIYCLSCGFAVLHDVWTRSFRRTLNCCFQWWLWNRWRMKCGEGGKWIASVCDTRPPQARRTGQNRGYLHPILAWSSSMRCDLSLHWGRGKKAFFSFPNAFVKSIVTLGEVPSGDQETWETGQEWFCSSDRLLLVYRQRCLQLPYIVFIN